MAQYSVSLILILILLAACVPTVTPQPATITPPPTVTPTPFVSPPDTPTPPPSPLLPAVVPTPQSNLSNSSFEEPYDCYGSAFCVAQDWRGWYINPPPCDPDTSGCYVACPLNCQKPDGTCKGDNGCYWAQPEFARSWGYANRLMSGLSSQKVFGYGRQFEGGLYRRVVAEQWRYYEFSIYMQAWMCYNFANCNNGLVSDMPAPMHMKVGIDPLGGTDPLSPNIVWGAEHDSFDAFSVYTVTAQALTGHITVFTSARPDWGWDTHLRVNNDLYLENADLKPLQYGPILNKFNYLPEIAR